MKPGLRLTIVNLVLVLSFAGFALQLRRFSAGSDKPQAAVPAQEKTLLAAVSEAAQWKPLDPRVAKAHEDLADFYSAEGRYADAEKVYQKTLELKEDMLGRANPAIIPAVDDVARVSFAQMKYDQAADLIARELRIMEREYGDDDPKLVPSLEQVARVLEAASKYPDAEKFLARAIAIREKASGPDERGADAGFEPTGAGESREAQSAGGGGAVRARAQDPAEPDFRPTVRSCCLRWTHWPR